MEEAMNKVALLNVDKLTQAMSTLFPHIVGPMVEALTSAQENLSYLNDTDKRVFNKRIERAKDRLNDIRLSILKLTITTTTLVLAADCVESPPHCTGKRPREVEEDDAEVQIATTEEEMATKLARTENS